MKIRIWGCRGSIPTPGPTTLRYGGNSTCLEIRTSKGPIIIVDAGSGVRNLGWALSQENVTQIRFFFTHSHWDHLVGFPFFQPAYSKSSSITFCSGPHAQDSIRSYLTHQMEAPYFPVGFNLLRAKFDFRCERPHMEPGHCRLDGLEVCPIPLSHPNGGYGYKFVEEQGKTFVFLTDNELGFEHEGGLSREQYVDFCRGADLLFHDAQFTDEEYKLTCGWGHSTFADATDLAIEAGVKRLGLVHHDPNRTDDDLDRQGEFCQERIRLAGGAVECSVIAEGTIIEL